MHTTCDTALLRAAYESIIPACPSFTVERIALARILRAAKASGPAEYAIAVEVAMSKRRGWLDYLTRTQRHWQQRTRRQSRANHHDSVQIREKYVRCAR